MICMYIYIVQIMVAAVIMMCYINLHVMSTCCE